MAGWLRKPDSAVVVSAVTFLVILIDKVYGHLGPRTSGLLGLLGISAIRSLSDVWTVAQLWRSFENFESSSFNAWTPPERHRIDLDRLEADPGVDGLASAPQKAGRVQLHELVFSRDNFSVWIFNAEWSSWKGDTVAFSVLLELSQILIYLLVWQRRSFFYTKTAVYASAKPDRYLE
ncbi:hypothetical protein SISSUDRAFT_1031685 [Sistotremastrum suecicum HHB10207 ss-3]|uniref:Uncharacterized protein n=1 Tax=Sistotremastrum suecicum HHB10207 ss-3 TaxID=1314776 RepID=A0A166FM47_9AGAM|nr:hypothetical protein SISSUDRAFT_1031685 [Sistotremastrum suecicum HHB10207 ss-3]